MRQPSVRTAAESTRSGRSLCAIDASSKRYLKIMATRARVPGHPRGDAHASPVVRLALVGTAQPADFDFFEYREREYQQSAG
jgi:hypothetical protein